MTSPRNKPAPPARIVIRREWRKGMFAPDYRIMCGGCDYVDKSDEMGAQTLTRKHNNEKHGGALIVKFDYGDKDNARTRAAHHQED